MPMQILGPSAEVRRPWLVALMGAAALAAAGLAMAGLVGLAMSLRAEPVTVVIADEELGPALAEAPWAESGGEGPVVWVVASGQCDGCADLLGRDLAQLEAEGLRVRLILVSPREGRHPRLDAWTAAFAETRDPSLLAPLRAHRPVPEVPRDDPAIIEGYLEWGRASYDRIAAIVARNGATLRAPSLFWRRGAEWRLAVGTDGAAADRALRELAPGA
ncbi:MAG: hypothetical protein JNJ73_17215 [Hyphomonadaceae bacterium]|nr:hypothetical protein [Hyphomonadaceae bacterium]